jgi:hypothetical protein
VAIGERQGKVQTDQGAWFDLNVVVVIRHLVYQAKLRFSPAPSILSTQRRHSCG